ncbi:hypothetical protein [Agrobacterium larrymoorei]|uniref:Uncharacterized protein n=1 Tax=Agrobacterium larrymoorei TaxID=160699 RepID=A0A4D7DTF1_9HYPH|nr:hypothetical protein [Agrobacterium larrymoorei]QCI98624.1 hypothetical protein CFBP5473_12395 [Agrobacterium larrymoorei]QYA05912.1 hypothetical protein J5285_07340 [Agrobacterium larrymoorei]
MSQIESEAIYTKVSPSFLYGRLLLVCAAVLLFATGSCAYDIINLPTPTPSNNIYFVSTLLYFTVFSSQSLILVICLKYFGKLFDAPPAGHEQRKWDFTDWVLKNPYAAVIIGPLVFISPFLLIFGLSGIVFTFVVGVGFYVTPRLLTRGPIGYALFLGIWLASGWTLSILFSGAPNIKECVGDKAVPLRSGELVSCETYIVIEKAKGLLIAYSQSSRFVPLKDLAPYEIESLGPGSWLIRGGIRPYQ